MAEPLTNTTAVAAILRRAVDPDDPYFGALIRLASVAARSRVPGIDAALALFAVDPTAPGALDPADVAVVLAAVVARASGTVDTPQGAKSVSRARGPFSETITYDTERAAAAVELTDLEVLSLGGVLAAAAGPRRVGNINLRVALG